MNPAINFYENVSRVSVIYAHDILGAEKYTHFKHSDSIHSFTAAFGVSQPRLACFCENEVTTSFELGQVFNNKQKKSHFMLKLIATWKDWKQFVHCSVIQLNGYDILNGPLFLENVCKGWPAIYFSLPPEILKNQNQIRIANCSKGKNTLVIERIEILKLPELRDFTTLSCPEFAIAEAHFSVKLNLLQEHPAISVKYPKSVLTLISQNGSEFKFVASHASTKKTEMEFISGSKRCKAYINEIYPKNSNPVHVGMDCDDYRQDKTNELDRIINHFADTQMGNFLAFRPKANRNFPAEFPATTQDWRRWIKLCKDKNIKFQFSALAEMSAKELLLFKKMIVSCGGANFAGFQIHEPYCVFSPIVNHPLAKKTDPDFKCKLKTYLSFVNSQINSVRYGKSKIFCGDPSLLCTYLKHTKTDSILCEPVSNSALLFGAARGTGKNFGAHIAPDWYGGFPHDKDAITRMGLLLNLIYAYGGQHIYIESTAFKTNAFSRNDWEDEFCMLIRHKLREFFKFTCKDQRLGKPDVPLAFIFGNLESMFWRPDDRIPELMDSGNWDDYVWGKWPDIRYRWLWKATDSWLPPLHIRNFGKNESLTKMFCGTPFGQVDVVSPDTDLSQYKAVAFLGWNTMDNNIYRNLLQYVTQGGTLFICGCHFDTRTSFKGKPNFIKNGKIHDLAGVDIIGSGARITENVRKCELKVSDATQEGEFLYVCNVGKGKTYFCSFYDYPSDMQLVNQIQDILTEIGKQVKSTSPIYIEGINSEYINYTIWKNGNHKKMYLSNIDWQDEEVRKITIKTKNKSVPVNLPSSKMLVVEL